MAAGEGIPLHGDRSAWDATAWPDEHAKGIQDAALQRHLPAPGSQYTFGVSDGTDWIISVGMLNIASGKTLTLAGSLTVDTDLSITGGGTIALGGYTLTIPATGTVALLGIANVFTATQTIQSTTPWLYIHHNSSTISDEIGIDFGATGTHKIARITVVGTINYGGNLHFETSVNDGAYQKRLTILEGGNVGIGTATPAPGAKLEVAGDIFVFDNGSDPRIVLGDSVSAGDWGSIRWNSTDDQIEIGTDTGGANTLVIDENGNVGIGCSSPHAIFKLHVKQGTNKNLGIRDIGGELAIEAVNDTVSLTVPLGIYSSELNLMGGNVGINTDSPDAKLQVVGDLKVGDDNTNYSEFEVDGTLLMVGAATVFNDLQFAISNAKVPASNAPTWETFTTNTNEYSFGVDDYIDTQANETPHGWKLGEAGNVHLHITTKAANSTGANRFAKFTVYVAYSDTGEAWQETSLTVELTIPDGTTALEQFYLAMGDLTLTNYIEEAEIRCRVKRIAATGGTEYSGNIFITQVGIHLLHDTIGSRTETAK